ncbi:MAG TPA: YigZ family protein [Candidatus Pelethocola excrementipullorum]|nr:YigZ family protein [Candidatus Pelethocola excrementipullorum]
MIERYKTIYEGSEAEIVEKKSRFIATIRLVETEEEALAFIEEMRKKYWNATHNCFAYTIGERQEIVRAGDDGEPGGTAGRPMLDVILGEGLHNTAAVVTRYFGGTLLGTGGLVRAYSSAVQAGLSASTIIEKQYGTMLEIQTDYNGIGKIQYFLGQRKIPIMDSQYTDQVAITILAPQSQIPALKAEIIEATNGRAVLTDKDELYFAVLDGQILTGDQLRA